jgi:hypothetical protein
MRKIILGIALIASLALSSALAPSAHAQTYENVSGLTPFTEATNFMSRPGYLRYRYFETSKTWISYEQAARIVAEQGG